MSVPYSLTKTALIIGLAISSAGAYAATEVNLNYQTRLQSRSAPSDVALQARACHSPVDPFTIEFDLKDVNTQGMDIIVTATGGSTNKNFDIFKSNRQDQRQSFTVPFKVAETTYRYEGRGQAMANTGTEKITRDANIGGNIGAHWPPYDQTVSSTNFNPEDSTICFAQTQHGHPYPGGSSDNRDPRIFFGNTSTNSERDIGFSADGNPNRKDHYYILYKYRAGTFYKGQPITENDLRVGDERNTAGFQLEGYRIRNLRTNQDMPYHYWHESCNIRSIWGKAQDRTLVNARQRQRDRNNSIGRPSPVYKNPNDIFVHWATGGTTSGDAKNFYEGVTDYLYRLPLFKFDKTINLAAMQGAGATPAPSADGKVTVSLTSLLHQPFNGGTKAPYYDLYQYNKMTGKLIVTLANRNISSLKIDIYSRTVTRTKNAEERDQETARRSGTPSFSMEWKAPTATTDGVTTQSSATLDLVRKPSDNGNFRSVNYNNTDFLTGTDAGTGADRDAFNDLYKINRKNDPAKGFLRGTLLGETHFKNLDALKEYKDSKNQTIALSKPAAKDGELRLLNMEKLVVQIRETGRSKTNLQGDNYESQSNRITSPTGKYEVSVYGEPLKFQPITKNGSVVMTADAIREACYIQQIQ